MNHWVVLNFEGKEIHTFASNHGVYKVVLNNKKYQAWYESFHGEPIMLGSGNLLTTKTICENHCQNQK